MLSRALAMQKWTGIKCQLHYRPSPLKFPAHVCPWRNQSHAVTFGFVKYFLEVSEQETNFGMHKKRSFHALNNSVSRDAAVFPFLLVTQKLPLSGCEKARCALFLLLVAKRRRSIFFIKITKTQSSIHALLQSSSWDFTSALLLKL